MQRKSEQRQKWHTKFLFVVFWCVYSVIRFGLPIHRAMTEVTNRLKFHILKQTSHFFDGLYIRSPFAIVLEDTVCLFRIYVHQSGNIGMSISLTDKDMSHIHV